MSKLIDEYELIIDEDMPGIKFKITESKEQYHIITKIPDSNGEKGLQECENFDRNCGTEFLQAVWEDKINFINNLCQYVKHKEESTKAIDLSSEKNVTIIQDEVFVYNDSESIIVGLYKKDDRYVLWTNTIPPKDGEKFRIFEQLWFPVNTELHVAKATL